MRNRLRRLLRPRIVVAVVVGLALLAGLTIWANRPTGTPYQTEDRLLTLPSGPDRSEPTLLDTRLYVPETATQGDPAPVVLLAHGFGGTKDSVNEDAQELAAQGYVVLSWTARGFGRSGGDIHLDSPDYEVNDARALLDWVAKRPQVAKDKPGDPKAGVVGGSYGGALALLLAANDQRVDAIVPHITWNNLETALFPGGVFKKGWAGALFTSGKDGAATGRLPASQVNDPLCGRFDPHVCALYEQAATTGRPSPELHKLLRRSSPQPVLGQIKAPTLLVQGTADTLFPLDQADANARGIARAGTPVRVAWFSGGHDGGAGSSRDEERTKGLTLQWLDHYLRGKADPGTSFTYSRVSGIDVGGERFRTVGRTTGTYPGIQGQRDETVALQGTPLPIANPPGGNPAALSSIPGTGGQPATTTGTASQLLATDIPGQAVPYASQPLDKPLDVTGSPRVRIKVASATGEAVVFVKLYDVNEQGRATLPGGLVQPLRLTGLAKTIDQAKPITVDLPPISYRFGAGHTLRLAIATTDQAYVGPAEPQVYVAGLAAGDIAFPIVDGKPLTDPSVIWSWVLLAVVVLLALGIAVTWLVFRRRARRREIAVVDAYEDTVLVVRNLSKTYADGLQALRGIDFEVGRGQVVGLLGPNGAGKTTCLRTLMGLIRPTTGEVLIFGHPLTPGAPTLSRIGALVEGPGFLPHLSGRTNLELYWRATGRPFEEAKLEEVLEIAGLGEAVHRKTSTYSHGMRQRLAVAQAMLGLPELLVLDEPTDGLDPPQIAEMRRVLRRYADDGRAVLVSSHLLAEVEQTCTHLVVLHRGIRVGFGPVSEVIGDSASVVVDVTDSVLAQSVLAGIEGVQLVAHNNGSLVVDLDGLSRADLVRRLVDGGVGVERISPHRRLEDAFLALVGGGER
ncbi:alpha/beta fold hydrolase [Flindersiella endophytica]